MPGTNVEEFGQFVVFELSERCKISLPIDFRWALVESAAIRNGFVMANFRKSGYGLLRGDR